MGTVLQFQVPRPAAEPRAAVVFGSAFAALVNLFTPREQPKQVAAVRAQPAPARRPKLAVTTGGVRPRVLGHA